MDDAGVIEGPLPREDGYVRFVVSVDDTTIEVCSGPMGILIPEWPCLEEANAAMRAVDRFIQEHHAEVWRCYRDAARRRRASGRPPHAGSTTSPHATVVGAERRTSGVVFSTSVHEVEIDVWVFFDGGLMDEYVRPVEDRQRDAAIGATLRHIFANPEQATTLGLDVELLAELWQ